MDTNDQESIAAFIESAELIDPCTVVPLEVRERIAREQALGVHSLVGRRGEALEELMEDVLDVLCLDDRTGKYINPRTTMARQLKHRKVYPRDFQMASKSLSRVEVYWEGGYSAAIEDVARNAIVETVLDDPELLLTVRERITRKFNLHRRLLKRMFEPPGSVLPPSSAAVPASSAIGKKTARKGPKKKAVKKS